MFRKDDYIVILQSKYPSDKDFPINFIFKQHEDKSYISVYKDACGDKNGWPILSFDKKISLEDWRYALPHEIEAYKQAGKPINVTKLTTEPQYEIY